MKTTFKTLICALALGTTVAFAGPGSDAKKATSFQTGIYKSLDGNLNVNIAKKATAIASLAILNANGDVLAWEGVGKKQTKARFRFDLSALPDGVYTLSVLSKGERETKQFTISSEKFEVTRKLAIK
jgi:hypothetical protein